MHFLFALGLYNGPVTIDNPRQDGHQSVGSALTCVVDAYASEGKRTLLRLVLSSAKDRRLGRVLQRSRTTGCKGWPVLKGGPRSSQHLCRPGAPVGAEISSVKVHRCSDPSSFFGRCPIHWSWFPASASARVAQRRCSTVLNLISSSRRHPKGLCRSGHQSIVARMLAADLSSLAAACASVCECCWCVCV